MGLRRRHFPHQPLNRGSPRLTDSKKTQQENRRIRTPGFSLGSMASFEQIGTSKYASHQQMSDESWQTTEAAEIPDPSGGVFVFVFVAESVKDPRSSENAFASRLARCVNRNEIVHFPRALKKWFSDSGQFRSGCLLEIPRAWLPTLTEEIG